MDDGILGLHELHRKWHKQVVETMHELHNRRIVWGDVNLFNIAIDDALNSWVIDFEGLNNA
jgi:RIO-like serine/threonine protein kinase